MKNFHSQKGFTLIDLLISVAIVSLLSSLTLFVTGEAKQKAQDSHMQTESREVANAIALYKNDHNGFVPLTSIGGSRRPGVIHSEVDPNSDYRVTMQTLVDRGYLAAIPTSPSGTSYIYGTSDDETGAVFGARLNKSNVGSNKNSCEIDLDTGVTTPRYSFGINSCTNGGRGGNPCAGYPSGTYLNGAICLDRTAQSVTSYCNISESGVYSVKTEYQYYYPSDFCSSSVIYDIFLCSAILLEEDEVTETAKCDGSSDSDYCQCI